MNLNTDNKKLIKNAIAGIFGNILEWYDFAVFGFLAPILGLLFFPEENKLVGIILTYSIFATGYIMRPIGGIIFGYIGDNMGRVLALKISIVMMAIPTVIIGFLPTFEDIGIFAAIILVILRMIQGLSVGGELIGSSSYLVEIAPSNKKGLFGSFTLFSAVGGLLLGSSIVSILNIILTEQEMISWGWRIPFILGIIIFTIGVWLRKEMNESNEYLSYAKEDKLDISPLKTVLKTMPLKVLELFLIISVITTSSYMLFVWMPTYLSKIINPPIPHALMLNNFMMILVLITIPIAGAISDKYGKRKVIMFTSLGIGISAYPLFLLLNQGSFEMALIALLIFAIFSGFLQGPLPALMAEMFPIKLRYTSIALGYNIATAIIGGTTPMVATILINETNNNYTPAFYLIFFALVSFITLYKIKNTMRESKE